MKSSPKPGVFLALYHQGKLSFPAHRNEEGLVSFHWALLITPKNAAANTHMLDVTDAMLIDPVKHVDTNPNRDWIFRDKVENPLANPQLILFAMIGKLQSRADGLDKLVEKDTEVKHCEWWVREAVLFLQATELLDQVDVDTTFLDAKRQATDRIDGADIARKRTEVVKFTSRACNVSFGD